MDSGGGMVLTEKLLLQILVNQMRGIEEIVGYGS
jgi:hypothetical protein